MPREVTIKLTVQENGRIECSEEMSRFIMFVADVLLKQHLEKAEEARPRIILAGE